MARPKSDILGAKFEEAIAWHIARTPITDDELAAIREDAKKHAFWISNVAQLGLVQDVFDEITRSIELGIPYDEFAARVEDKLYEAWGGEMPYRVRLIWFMAVQTAYNAGRWHQMEQPDMMQSRPYRMYDAVLDDRTSVYCKIRDGIVRKSDDPWWDSNWPPLHYNCRSSVRPLTEKQAKRRGIGHWPTRPDPQPGFGDSPRKSNFADWKPSPDKYDPASFRELINKAEISGI